MVSARLVLASAVAALTVLSACHRLSSAEEKVVGTWHDTGLDSTYRWVFKPNRSFIILAPDQDFEQNHKWLREVSGSWRIDGTLVVMDATIHLGPKAGMREHDQFKIIDFADDKLVREGRSPLVRAK